MGDAFEVFNFGSSLGITSIGTATCNSAATCDAAGPSFSRGDFLLGAGGSTITMNVTSYFGSPGNLFFNVKDVTDVPEPATLALLGLGLAGLGFPTREGIILAALKKIPLPYYWGREVLGDVPRLFPADEDNPRRTPSCLPFRAML